MTVEVRRVTEFMGERDKPLAAAAVALRRASGGTLTMERQPAYSENRIHYGPTEIVEVRSAAGRSLLRLERHPLNDYIFLDRPPWLLRPKKCP